jgi:hypothetical protein
MKRWTMDEDNRLIFLSAEATQEYAARELGRSVSSITSRCHRLGIGWRKGRRTLKDVAHHLGYTSRGVCIFARRHGIKIRRPKAVNSVGTRGDLNVSDEIFNRLVDAVKRECK